MWRSHARDRLGMQATACFVEADVFRRHWRSSEKLKRQTVNQTTACVRTAHTLHVGFEVPSDSSVGCVAQPSTRSVGYAGHGLLRHMLYPSVICIKIKTIFCNLLNFILNIIK